MEYDIRNKTYDQLPEELKEKFGGYQIEDRYNIGLDDLLYESFKEYFMKQLEKSLF